jgi:hypothetical protein
MSLALSLCRELHHIVVIVPELQKPTINLSLSSFRLPRAKSLCEIRQSGPQRSIGDFS